MVLTLSVLIPDKERKLTSIFIFTLLCFASEGFMKVLKTFIKPFEAPERSVKIKVLVNFDFYKFLSILGSLIQYAYACYVEHLCNILNLFGVKRATSFEVIMMYSWQTRNMIWYWYVVDHLGFEYRSCYWDGIIFGLKWICRIRNVNPLIITPAKWSNTLKQFVGNLPANCLSVFDHFVGLALKGLNYLICLFNLGATIFA